MTQKEQPGSVRAPDFRQGVTWLQGGPLKLADLAGRMQKILPGSSS